MRRLKLYVLVNHMTLNGIRRTLPLSLGHRAEFTNVNEHDGQRDEGKEPEITSKYGSEVNRLLALALEHANLDRSLASLLGTGLGLAVPC